MIFEDTSGIPYETVVSLDGKKKKIQFTLQGSPTTRQKFLAKHRRRAVLFSPIDMNLVYLSPSLRRNFLDEILLLSHHDFQQIRKKYASTLKSRNALLKKFAKHGGNREEIQVWDTLFVELCMIYQDHRDNILSHLQTSLKSKDEKIRKNIQIELIYSSELAKIKKEHRKDYIQNTLHNSLERDILIGHTCIGPHLDDLELNVYTNNKKLHCSELLSR
jgi:DNA replication and repair protein RecF